MSFFVLYMVMLKATLTSFNGQSSLPILRNDLVVTRHVLTDRQLSTAVAAARCSPGPMGIYVVDVGYIIDGWPGAFAGFLALISPAVLIIPLLKYAGKRVEHPRVRRVLDSAVIATVGLILCSSAPLAQDAIPGIVPAVLAIASLTLLVTTRIQTLWLIGGSALCATLISLFHQ